MSKNVSRFIQVSDAVLLEYNIYNYDGGVIEDDDVETIQVSNTSRIVTLGTGEQLFINNDLVNCLALPIGNNNADYFNTLNKYDVTFEKFLDAYTKSTGKTIKSETSCISETIPYDVIRLHVSTGYMFDNAYGFFLKVYTKSSDEDQQNVQLLSYAYNKTFSKFTYNMNPIFFSNRMFDKYIEIKIPSVKYLSLNTNSPLGSMLKVNNGLNNINIVFNDLYDGNYTVYDLDSVNSGLYRNDQKVMVDCGEFTVDKRSATSIPVTATTDNFNIYISENTSGDYIEYYTTWKGTPLNSEIVSKFNTTIPLYNVSRTAFNNRYEAANMESNEMWCVMHTLNVYLNCGTNQYLLDNISNTQYFNANSNGTKFYYRPIPNRINELGISVTDIDSILIIYNAKLINLVDGTGTQILRTGSIAVKPDRYLINANNNLNASDIFNYTIYNKIVKTNQQIQNNAEVSKVKYTKVFYNNSNINLSGNTGSYTLALGNSPKNYKFTFTQDGINNTTDYLNFSNSYYKLYSRDVDGNDIYIDATYSDNMNPVLGELEFYIPISVIKKLKAVPTANRFMSIVAVNQDNTISTVYEFTYA